ncbi:MAG: chemotaxis protein CheW [Rhodocyclaceae bacterium]
MRIASQPDTNGTGGQYLIFSLGRERFAANILNIKEIIEFRSLTEVPMMPTFVRGVLNLRGSVVPVIDLTARFGRGQTAINPRTCVVIVEMHDENHHIIGVMVNAVCEVMEIADANIEPPPSFGTHLRADFIHGMARVEDEFVIALKLDTVLSAEELGRLASERFAEGCAA